MGLWGAEAIDEVLRIARQALLRRDVIPVRFSQGGAGVSDPVGHAGCCGCCQGQCILPGGDYTASSGRSAR
eukprot:8952253-Prorocentrum_lima.AAC.1